MSQKTQKDSSENSQDSLSNDDKYYSDSDTESLSSDFECDYNTIADSEGDEGIFEIEENYDQDNTRRGNDRVSLNRMTKYEMVRILGERIKQLTLGAKCFIRNKEDFDYETLALEELRAKLIPFKIIRILPNNVKEEWKIDELEVDHLLN